MTSLRSIATALLALWFGARALADLTLTPTTDQLPLTEGLAIGGVTNSARRTINVDAIAAAVIDGTILSGPAAPKAGTEIDLPSTLGGGKAKWEDAKPDETGSFAIARGGYLACTVVAQQARAMILEARGHAVVYVNGEPRVGDPYAAGYVRVPIALRQGPNLLLFASGRGGVVARLVAPTSEIELQTADVTTPDILTDTRGPGRDGCWLLAVPVLNCGDAPRDLEVAARVKGDLDWGPAESFTIAPLGVCKSPALLKATAKPGQKNVAVELRVTDPLRPTETLAAAEITINVRAPHEKHKRTFRSAIDNSVQYYAVVPPPAPPADSAAAAPPVASESPALVLSLHGAGVEATNQANCYAQRPNMVIACPTNRRPYGFDWEDWGRVDGIEAMRDAAAIYKTDPTQTYLTGHSMGGHGTWQLGTLFPHLFAAIAPSAGWLSFETYTGRAQPIGAAADDPIVTMLARANASSNTIAHMPNLMGKPIFILHGTADDNVPLEQAQRARDELTKLGIEFKGHDEKDAGHWWGDRCVDWPGIFELFASSRLAGFDPATDSQRHRFTVLQCGASGDARGPVIVEQQERVGLPSTVDITCAAAGRRATGSTSNVTRISIDPAALLGKGHARIELDGGSFESPVPPGDRLVLVKVDGQWTRASTPRNAAPKSAALAGPFKQAFNNNFVLIYGTSGTADENAWSLAKARFDADQWWYRGNGRATVLADTRYLHDRPDGNVILYGNKDTNRAWATVLPRSQIDLRRGSLVVHDKLVEGDDAACLFVQPWREGDDKPWRLAGVIGGTGLKGMRATDRLPYFLSGTGFPDLLVLRASAWQDGYGAVLAAGFFDNQWGLTNAEITWRPNAAAVAPVSESVAPEQPEE